MRADRSKFFYRRALLYDVRQADLFRRILMLTIRADQLETFSQDIQSRQRSQIISEICVFLRREAPALMAHYPDPQHEPLVAHVVDAALKAGISDPGHLLNWAYIRFLINMPFYEMEQFKEIIDHPVLHPYSKGRHIVLAFFAIHDMNRKAGS